MQKSNELHSMKLHDVLTPNTVPHTMIIRVPGGWVYRFFNESGNPYAPQFVVDSVFVPWSIEFAFDGASKDIKF